MTLIKIPNVTPLSLGYLVTLMMLRSELEGFLKTHYVMMLLVMPNAVIIIVREIGHS